jgi:peptidoglycan/LPS O-acetylase OafA/YrhL
MKSSKWKSRKWLAALVALGLIIWSMILFSQNMSNPNASLLLSLVVTPCLGIIAIVAGVQGVHDVKWRENNGEADSSITTEDEAGSK